MAGDCFEARDVSAEVFFECFIYRDELMEVVRHNGILEEAYLWREAFPFEEGVAHGFTGGGVFHLHCFPAMCEGCFAPAVGEVAEVWRVGVFKEGEVVFPGGSVVVAFHAVGAGALGVVYG